MASRIMLQHFRTTAFVYRNAVWICGQPTERAVCANIAHAKWASLTEQRFTMMSGIHPKPRPIEYFICTYPECEDVYMTSGGEKIGLAQFPRVGIRINTNPEKQGPCPKHRKKLSE